MVREAGVAPTSWPGLHLPEPGATSRRCGQMVERQVDHLDQLGCQGGYSSGVAPVAQLYYGL